jgi:hypothetical protein
MNFGYLIIVANDEKIDYHKMAMMLAYSIKRTQKPGYDRVALATDDRDSIKLYSKSMAFDRIIYWDGKKHWDSRSYMNKITPWKYTVCLDADMLFVRDHSHWIDYFVKNSDLHICSDVYNFKNELVIDSPYRKETKDNNMPNLYSAYTYFNSNSQFSYEFFALVQYITEFPDEFKNLYYQKGKPAVLGTDEIFSLAAKILDIEDKITYPLEFPKFVHMKSKLQNFTDDGVDWLLELGLNVKSVDDIKIGCFSQHDIIHYVDKRLASNPILPLYEKKMIENFKL